MSVVDFGTSCFGCIYGFAVYGAEYFVCAFAGGFEFRWFDDFCFAIAVVGVVGLFEEVVVGEFDGWDSTIGETGFECGACRSFYSYCGEGCDEMVG